MFTLMLRLNDVQAKEILDNKSFPKVVILFNNY